MNNIRYAVVMDNGSATPPEELDDETKAACEKFQKILSNVSFTPHKLLAKELIALEVSSTKQKLAKILEILFDEVLDKPIFLSYYAELCKDQVLAEIEKSDKRTSPFQNALLIKLQALFQYKKDVDKGKLMGVDNDNGSPCDRLMEIIEEEKKKFKQRMWGVIGFMGHLHIHALVSSKIIHACFHESFCTLLPKKIDGGQEVPPSPETVDNDSIYCGLGLLETTGKKIDSGGEAFLDQWFQKLEAGEPYCSEKCRRVIKFLKELRANKWIPKQ